jgi:predicted RecA/RadA family phage recombinase
MKNFIQPGNAIDVVTPSGGYVAGNFYIQGSLGGVAALTTAETEANVLHVVGVYELTKVGSEAWAIGDPIYWDTSNSRATKTFNAAHVLIGAAAAVVGSGAGETLGKVRLNGAVAVVSQAYVDDAVAP